MYQQDQSRQDCQRARVFIRQVNLFKVDEISYNWLLLCIKVQTVGYDDSKTNGTTGQAFYILKCGSLLKFEEESFEKKHGKFSFCH